MTNAQLTANARKLFRIIAIGRSDNGQPFKVVSDPYYVQWLQDGAPSCGATWDGDYSDLLPAWQREDWVGE